MNYRQGQYPIIKKQNLAKNCYDFTVFCPEMALIAQPGQFAHIKVNGFTLRRPISICEIDKDKGTMRFVFEVRGDGTSKLSDLQVGMLMDIMAPLGNGFTLLDSREKAIVVGGGIGVPPLLELSKNYGENVTAIIGFRTAGAVILNEDFQTIGADVRLCTDDGTMGRKGYVSDELEEVLKTGTFDMIYACGPHMMLKAVIALADRYNIPCEVSMEERMGCGVGACLVCACKTVKNSKEYYSHVCKDGPVFNSKEVLL